MSNVQLGALDRIPPPEVAPASIAVAAFPNRIDMQWGGSADDRAGSVFAYFQVLRDGAAFATVPAAAYTDATLAPGESRTYTIIAVDQHMNASAGTSFTASAAPAGAIDPRRTDCAPKALTGAPPASRSTFSPAISTIPSRS